MNDKIIADYYDNGALMPESEDSRDLMMVLDTPAKMSENSTKASGKKPLYYIRGVKDRGKEVLNELIKLGGTSDAYVFGDTENLYYLINSCNYIISTPVISDLADILLGYGVELYLPEPKYKFTVGEKVLYRFDDSQWWRAGRFVCVAINGFVVEKRKDKNGTYSQCIPLKGNEELLLTDDEYKQQ